MLNAQKLNFSFGKKTILDNATLTLLEGDRVALVGQNGAGKSTLLDILFGLTQPDSGSIEYSKQTKIGLLRQNPSLDSTMSVTEAVKLALKDHIENIKQHQKLCDELEKETDLKVKEQKMKQIDLLTQKIEFQGGFDVDYKVENVLTRLKIKAREQKIAELSGGEKRRVDLARILLESPDIYFLDEPTNHLDFSAIEFLVDTFKKSKAALLFISHDTAFIDNLANKIVELDKGKLYTHEPPYADFIENKLVREMIENRSLHRKERLMLNELAWLRAGTPARTTKQNARIGRAYELIDDVVKKTTEQRKQKLDLQKSDSLRLGKTILELNNISAKINDRILFRNLNLKVCAHQRFGIVGPNGAGKTTLLSIITQKIKPFLGEVILGKNTKIVSFDQHRDLLEDDKTLKEMLCDDGDYVFISNNKIHIASYLEKYLFSADDYNRKVGTLSGGEKNRLLMAKLLKNEANCLILDEPTNDLDVTSLSVLEEFLLDYEGVAFIVSHDIRFLDKICNGIIAFEPSANKDESNVVVYQGNYSIYQSLKPKNETVVTPKNTVPKEEKRVKEKPKKRGFNEERELSQIEQVIENLENEKTKLYEELADPVKFSLSGEGIKERSTRLSLIEHEIEKTYKRWQELLDMG